MGRYKDGYAEQEDKREDRRWEQLGVRLDRIEYEIARIRIKISTLNYQTGLTPVDEIDEAARADQ